MKTTSKKLVLISFIILVGCSIPEEEVPWPDHWQKGNLHTHSFWSDGDDYPEMIMLWYKDHGYQFVGLSDHNVLQEGEKWMTVTQSPMRIRAYEKYKSEYGDWVDSKEDSSGLQVKLRTLAEYRDKFEEDNGFLILKSEEITSSFEGKPIHINATNISELIPGQEGESVSDVIQKVIDEVNQQRERTGIPMIPHINHPNFGWGITAEDIMKVNGERFFEVYNGHPAVNNYGNESHSSTEEIWDQINMDNIEKGKPLMYGIATDDSHNYHLFGSQFSNTGRGWIMVNSETLDPESLISAMEDGKFYASTGVTLSNYLVSAQRIKFTIDQEQGVTYIIEFLGVKEGSDKVEVLQKGTNNEVEYLFTGNEKYVRARISSNKLKLDPYQVGDYEAAWTQPVIPVKK